FHPRLGQPGTDPATAHTSCRLAPYEAVPFATPSTETCTFVMSAFADNAQPPKAAYPVKAGLCKAGRSILIRMGPVEVTGGGGGVSTGGPTATVAMLLTNAFCAM